MPIRELSPDQKKRYRKPAGVLVVLLGIFLIWFTMYRPLVEARLTGVLHFSYKAAIFMPFMLYFGACLMFTTLEDDDFRHISPNGQRSLTRAGWLFFAGLVIFLVLFDGAWILYLRTQGFNVL